MLFKRFNKVITRTLFEIFKHVSTLVEKLHGEREGKVCFASAVAVFALFPR